MVRYFGNHLPNNEPVNQTNMNDVVTDIPSNISPLIEQISNSIRSHDSTQTNDVESKKRCNLK